MSGALMVILASLTAAVGYLDTIENLVKLSAASAGLKTQLATAKTEPMADLKRTIEKFNEKMNITVLLKKNQLNVSSTP